MLVSLLYRKEKEASESVLTCSRVTELGCGKATRCQQSMGGGRLNCLNTVSRDCCALTLCFTLFKVIDTHAPHLFLQHSWEVSGIPVLPMATLKFGKELLAQNDEASRWRINIHPLVQQTGHHCPSAQHEPDSLSVSAFAIGSAR